ncbi:MAG: hypothetical protein INR73_17830 [Williamsia sp.]|nr:hypothetical protein [Williamsia sp.]
MINLSFLAKVAFLYNLCMVATLVMRYLQFIQEGALQSTILVSGIVLSIVFNGLVNSWAIVVLLVKKSPGGLRPLWLFGVNFLCFIFQLYLLI